jgi:hypothetical protein
MVALIVLVFANAVLATHALPFHVLNLVQTVSTSILPLITEVVK